MDLGLRRCVAKSAQAKYYAMIALIDDQLARILKTLDDTIKADTLAEAELLK